LCPHWRWRGQEEQGDREEPCLIHKVILLHLRQKLEVEIDGNSPRPQGQKIHAAFR
jgi:hypothetical protein